MISLPLYEDSSLIPLLLCILTRKLSFWALSSRIELVHYVHCQLLTLFGLESHSCHMPSNYQLLIGGSKGKLSTPSIGALGGVKPHHTQIYYGDNGILILVSGKFPPLFLHSYYNKSFSHISFLPTMNGRKCLRGRAKQ